MSRGLLPVSALLTPHYCRALPCRVGYPAGAETTHPGLSLDLANSHGVTSHVLHGWHLGSSRGPTPRGHLACSLSLLCFDRPGHLYGCPPSLTPIARSTLLCQHNALASDPVISATQPSHSDVKGPGFLRTCLDSRLLLSVSSYQPPSCPAASWISTPATPAIHAYIISRARRRTPALRAPAFLLASC
jgi:hypothetical protein